MMPIVIKELVFYGLTFIFLGFFALPCNSLTVKDESILPVTSSSSSGGLVRESSQKQATNSSLISSFVQSLDNTLSHAEKLNLFVSVADFDFQKRSFTAPKTEPASELEEPTPLDEIDRAAADEYKRWTQPGITDLLTPTVSGITGKQRQPGAPEPSHQAYQRTEFSWEDWFGMGTDDRQVNKRRRIMMVICASMLIGALYLTCRWSKPESRHVSWSDAEEQQSTVVPSLCNFLCQYNYSNSSVPVLFMRMHFPYNKSGVPLWFDFVFLSTAFVGSCLGILVLGVCGDIIGRKRCLQFSLALVAVGALMSSYSWGNFFTTYWWIVGWRFIIGIGIGGCVPLSAVLSNEDTQGLVARAIMTGRAFFWSAPGQLAPYVLALVMMETFTAYGLSVESLHTVFIMNTIILGVGAIPAIAALWILTKHHKDQEAFESQKAKTLGRLLEIVKQNPKHCFTLMGTGGSWFILNMVFYGTWMYVPLILYQLQPQLPLHDVEMQSSVVGLTAVPGILFAISLTRQLGLRLLNVFGFLLQAVTYLAMAYLHDSDKPIMKFGTLCFLVFALNSGPSVGTYVLPTLCYPSHIRSTFHAFSAYAGKLGAVIGAFAAEPIMRLYGMRTLFTIHACLCLLGALMSVAFLRRDSDYGQLDKVNMPIGVKKKKRDGEHSPKRGDLSPRMRGEYSPRRSKVEEPSFGPPKYNST
jgi:MFS family permease